MEFSTIVAWLSWHKKLDNDSARKEVDDMIRALCRMIQKGNFPSLITNIHFEGDKTILLMFDGKKLVFDPLSTVPILVYPKGDNYSSSSGRSPLLSWEKQDVVDGQRAYEDTHEDDMN